MKKMKKAEKMITAAENLYLECYKEFLWAKKNLGDSAELTNSARIRWAALYDMMKKMGMYPDRICVENYDEIFSK